MSRIGKKPVAVPDGAKVAIDAAKVSVEGPKGKLALELPVGITAALSDDQKQVLVQRSGDGDSQRALHGLARSLINNMLVGVTEGFVKVLKIVGTGFNGKVEGKDLVLNVGFCKPVRKAIPEGLAVEMNGAQEIVVRGADKGLVGEFAAEVRAARKPEPYKGKGIRYRDEVVRKKAGKAFVGAG